MGMHMESWPQRHRITVHDYHPVLERPATVPVTHLHSVTLNVGALFTP
jgi:hypothetical protein